MTFELINIRIRLKVQFTAARFTCWKLKKYTTVTEEKHNFDKNSFRQV